MLTKTLTTALLAATGALASSQYVTVNLWTGDDCTGTFHQETIAYDTGNGNQVYQYGYTWASGSIAGGASACGVAFCQYGSSCYNNPDVSAGWSPNCYTGGPTMAFDKILVNTC
ncbi:hypothetical protein BO82DRAFT_398802 [Aspergillus uvarum CBS 121591]|uniref:Uncharacterized protein n=3 Tax=Aspergillus TaxID=5052 RepID=A0A319DBD0_9EURO|nr:hypothetical protein BO82DRAFT_398802 [Aspergillus uvarum CBS 121591]XP_025530839.1 hypothetical protein BO86DRAFT_396580 [Aspergillus japonicus CBS 114.51]PYH85378.1 hypothetical protein BO82DRAFT_398802 [Aspergillus uvarum CBS 121591]RAH84945.1 hypothetical protein BO86DRAFT_396580 [Aspergillus japonicus CBS 114.51]